MNGQINPKDHISGEDKKDALEAFNSFNGARVLLFWVFLLLPMFVIQACFWTVQCGAIDAVLLEAAPDNPAGGVIPVGVASGVGQNDQNNDSPDTQSNVDPCNTAARLTDILEGRAPDDSAEPVAQRVDYFLDSLIRAGLQTSLYILSFSAVIYCLVLLIGIKLALVGQLGGLADSSKAFFLSLIVMVLILPWQQAISPELHGALYTYRELTERYQTLLGTQDPKAYVLYYGRFVGLWGLTTLLLIIAQWRGRRALQQIRQRLTAAATPILPDELTENGSGFTE